MTDYSGTRSSALRGNFGLGGGGGKRGRAGPSATMWAAGCLAAWRRPLASAANRRADAAATVRGTVRRPWSTRSTPALPPTAPTPQIPRELTQQDEVPQ